jgi:hypothetical protein
MQVFSCYSWKGEHVHACVKTVSAALSLLGIKDYQQLSAQRQLIDLLSLGQGGPLAMKQSSAVRLLRTPDRNGCIAAATLTECLHAVFVAVPQKVVSFANCPAVICMLQV